MDKKTKRDINTDLLDPIRKLYSMGFIHKLSHMAEGYHTHTNQKKYLRWCAFRIMEECRPDYIRYLDTIVNIVCKYSEVKMTRESIRNQFTKVWRTK